MYIYIYNTVEKKNILRGYEYTMLWRIYVLTDSRIVCI